MPWCATHRHNYYGLSCYSCDPIDDVGQVGIDMSGHLDVGLGNGLAIDVTDGDLVIGGIDTGLEL